MNREYSYNLTDAHHRWRFCLGIIIKIYPSHIHTRYFIGVYIKMYLKGTSVKKIHCMNDKLVRQDDIPTTLHLYECMTERVCVRVCLCVSGCVCVCVLEGRGILIVTK